MTRFRFSTDALLASVGDIIYNHGTTHSSSTSYEVGERASIKLLLPRSLGADTVKMRFLDGGENIATAPIRGAWAGTDSICDIYDFHLGSLKKAGITFFCFEIRCVFGEIYASSNDGRVWFTTELERVSCFQISVSDFKYREPTHLAGGVIYHVFVDRFARGGEVPIKDGAVLAYDWSAGVPEFPEYPGAPLRNNTFYGGTLYGIVDKLDYIASLGVNTIYLSPIFDAASNHKYDTGDYMSVDRMFGSDEALEKLIDEAKARGIGIILDGVFNHTGDDSIYFNKYGKYDSLGAAQSTASPYYSWYDFQSHPDKYTCWWGIDILPRINPDNPSCADYFVGDGGVVEKYAKMGIAGFRLDVVDELSDCFVERIKSKLNEHNPESILYGEVWEDASNKIAYGTRKRYYLGSELDGVMNYPLRTGIISYVRDRSTSALKYALTEIINNAPERVRHVQMNVLGTHDTERILTVLGGERPDVMTNASLRTLRMTPAQRELAKERLKAAYTVLATLPGIPTIFYGDEAGLEGYHDPFNRMPYPWDNADEDLISHYRTLGCIRRDNEVYRTGEFKLLHLDRDLLVFARYRADLAYVTVFNNSDEHIEIQAPRRARSLLGVFDGTLPPMTAQVFETATGTTFIFNY